MVRRRKDTRFHPAGNTRQNARQRGICPGSLRVLYYLRTRAQRLFSRPWDKARWLDICAH